MVFKDISKSPAGSTNARFHALGFTKHWDQVRCIKVAVFSRGDEVYRVSSLSAANELLARLES